jgi:hypothetical protein
MRAKGLQSHKKGFVFDALFLFFGVLILLVALVLAYTITQELNTLSTGMPGQSEVVNFNNNLQDLDWVVPFFVGIGSVAMLTYASTSASPPIAIVLFVMLALVVSVVVVYLNVFNIDFLTASGLVAQFPYTSWTINALPFILVLNIAIMGIIMHTRVY